MSTIRPLTGIRYATETSVDLSNLLAPPYDILDEQDKAELLARDARNFVKLDLPFLPPKSAGPPQVYTDSRQTMDAWLADGTLVRDSQPAIYVYHQKFKHRDTEYTRKMFFARLKLEPFGKGSIFPHEQTFGGPKEDRLALTKATEANLSPIFGLYEDPENVVAQRLEKAIGSKPLARGTLEDVDNLMWAVTDAGVIAEVVKLMADKPTYIADGHHRCGTAMLYRDWLVEQKGKLPEDHPANFVLCVFCAMEDPGLLILPTHRVLPNVTVNADTFAADENVEVHPLNASGPTQAIADLKDFGPQAVGVYCAATRSYDAVRPIDEGLLDAIAPEHSQPWRRLGLAFLHAYVLDRVVTPSITGGKPAEIKYIKSDEDAVTAARESKGTAFLLQPTTMEELHNVCTAGDLMPQKSTYFFPKLASGLIVNPLT